MELPRRHVPARLTSTPSVLAAGRTVVLASERPELCCDSSGTCAGLVSSFLAASKIAAAAFGSDRASVSGRRGVWSVLTAGPKVLHLQLRAQAIQSE
jgi:hypothetical protein